jgi:hypothetical protein
MTTHTETTQTCGCEMCLAVIDAALEVKTSVMAQLDDMSDGVAQHLSGLDGTNHDNASAMVEDLQACLLAAVEQRFSDWRADNGL